MRFLIREDCVAAVDAWHGLPQRLMGLGWATASASAAMSTVRAMVHAGSVLCQVTVGLGATRLHCLIAGHDDLFIREPGRLSLRCRDCGRRTAGLDNGVNSAARRVPISWHFGFTVATEPAASGMLRPPLGLLSPTRGT